ncbi:MAG TPA: hypothetical protein VNK70_02895 [Candidatus Paceibacterota bacterium]|nr:hypothetical protein [Candidatus Paceibacterota bacterium]
MKKTYIIGGIVILGVSFLVLVQVFKISSDGKEFLETTPFSEAVSETAGLELQTSEEGAVTVTVKPVSLSADSWNFEIVLDTHSEELTADLTKVAVLVDENGREYAPLGWEGSPPGGHHRKGILKFRPITPNPRVINLFIREIGGVEKREFLWITSS